jgi:putative N-acetylmannosamine-6-phosphate epimerase
MLLREIIKPQKSSFTMRLPDEMVGKTVEVIAFEVTDTNNPATKAQRLARIEELTKATMVDLSGFKFDRDRANDY